ncbi:hypothetical protein Btru_002561 [Bulinus truncatus]|nr:hypothetical protein Btru_002561 [Bulinus truncatus]
MDETDDQFAQKSCKKFEKHVERTFLNSFIQLDPAGQLDPVVDLIKAMGELTGMIQISKRGHKGFFPGTCFLQRIRTKQSGQRAILTFTTVYHIFGYKGDSTYELTQELSENNTKVRLFYDDYGTEDQHCVLDGFRLLETDKEVDIQNDWCAIECEIDNLNLIEKLEGLLKCFQEKQKEVYEMSQRPEFKNHLDKKIVIIVGHPHGEPKQVSEGYWIEKKIAKEVRNGQRWCKYIYEAPTCPGNSGSPVFIFGQHISGFGYWFGHSHNHKCGVDYTDVTCTGESSIGVELTVP